MITLLSRYGKRVQTACLHFQHTSLTEAIKRIQACTFLLALVLLWEKYVWLPNAQPHSLTVSVCQLVLERLRAAALSELIHDKQLPAAESKVNESWEKKPDSLVSAH